MPATMEIQGSGQATAKRQWPKVDLEDENGEKHSKADLIRSLYRQGITAPTDIRDWFDEQGIEVAAPQIYQTINKIKMKEDGVVPEESKPQVQTPVVQTLGLAPSDLTVLGHLVRKAGGAKALAPYLEVLESLMQPATPQTVESK